MVTQKIILEIEGMHCGACATAIELMLGNSQGVVRARVDFDKKIGEIEYDSEKTKTEDLIKIIEELGYQALKI